MWCTTECWSCEDKTCEHYIDKTQLYFKNKQLEEEIKQLKEERENLIHIVANKIIADYDIESPLKEELNNARIKNLALESEINRLNSILKYLEKYFSEREYYEFAQLVRDAKEANIEWLEQGVK